MREVKQRDNKGRFVKGHSGLRNEANPMWRGDDVKYGALHDWVASNLGKPRYCERCGTTQAKKYEWSNTSGLYRRELSDWTRLCVSCHRITDGHGFKMWQTRRNQNA